VENDRPEDEQHIVFVRDALENENEQPEKGPKLMQIEAESRGQKQDFEAWILDLAESKDVLGEQLKESIRHEEQLCGLYHELIQSTEEMNHRLVESRRHEQDLDAQILELVKNNDELEEQLKKSGQCVQDLKHRHSELLQNEEQLKERLAESRELKQDFAVRIQELPEGKDKLEHKLAQSRGHWEQRLEKAVRREDEIDDSQRESKTEFENSLQEVDQFPQEHLQIILKYRNSRKLCNCSETVVLVLYVIYLK